MTEKAISPLRQRLIDDMAIRQLGPKTQHEYIRHVKSFADFVGRFPDKATTEDVQRMTRRRSLLVTGASRRGRRPLNDAVSFGARGS